MVKTNRNMWVLILLSLVTFGIYPLFYWASVGEDVNKMCAADGKTTQNFWIAWLLGLITAGVFQLVWIYGVVERRNQRAGSASVPLKGGGSVLAFPLRGGVPHVRPQVKLVPGADRPVLVRRVAVLGRVRTQPYVRRIATKFRRQFFLRKYDIQVFF